MIGIWRQDLILNLILLFEVLFDHVIQLLLSRLFKVCVEEYFQVKGCASTELLFSWLFLC